MYAQWDVMRLARQHGVKVLLDGQGADELLAGYLPFDVYLAQALVGGRWRTCWSEAQAISRVGSRSTAQVVSRLAGRLLPRPGRPGYKSAVLRACSGLTSPS